MVEDDEEGDEKDLIRDGTLVDVSESDEDEVDDEEVNRVSGLLFCMYLLWCLGACPNYTNCRSSLPVTEAC